jgi:hypothetical protein
VAIGEEKLTGIANALYSWRSSASMDWRKAGILMLFFIAIWSALNLLPIVPVHDSGVDSMGPPVCEPVRMCSLNVWSCYSDVCGYTYSVFLSNALSQFVIAFAAPVSLAWLLGRVAIRKLSW